MKKRQIAPENRRVVTKGKKIAIVAVFLVGLLLLIWFKIPFSESYSAVLMLQEAGEVSAPEHLDVEITVRVTRHFLARPTHVGEVRVNGERFSNDNGTVEASSDLFGAMAQTDSFDMVCGAWRGDYYITRCVACVTDGRIVSLSLYDENGVYAGRYTRLPGDSK